MYPHTTSVPDMFLLYLWPLFKKNENRFLALRDASSFVEQSDKICFQSMKAAKHKFKGQGSLYSPSFLKIIRHAALHPFSFVMVCLLRI